MVGTEKTSNAGSLSENVQVISFKFCMILTSIELHTFIPGVCLFLCLFVFGGGGQECKLHFYSSHLIVPILNGRYII